MISSELKNSECSVDNEINIYMLICMFEQAISRTPKGGLTNQKHLISCSFR